MFRFLFTLIILECLLVDVLSLYCYICSNCEENSNYISTSQLIGTTNDLSCYKIISKLSDNSEIIIRGYSYAKCSTTQITDVWGYKQGSCCSTDYCNTTNRINVSITLVLFIFIILFYAKIN